ncbi:GNAT family N-acetyltransferase [Salipaludibacillus agaradhaerens]|uniref:GNAT family N-acetyltransferase n=1 Tax=Salipaludibacillus agaradhaerens TaxID=76935 RepID=UPI002151CC54|nr:GNAT family N-acetyltransferase [Salipaludibacillus agaradhaerens]MCR6105869.1 GNAT family N-acetyltransferase [Salipaludibacillus agaradhaerens]MCR6117904.1 GNAT family N-acetyltransferase [Salipaludibacillus agaradhaerens]
MAKDYEVLFNTPPTLEEFIYLCSSVGWEDYMNFDVAEISLQNSLFSVSIKKENKIIGMGRVVGDGIGKEIMNILMNYIEENGPNKVFVGLFASEGKEEFYQKYDFIDYSPNMTGMFKVNMKK